jgi:hypothetical protein
VNHTPRTKLGLKIDWGLVLFFILLAGACVARGQSNDTKVRFVAGAAQAEPTICGKYDNPTAYIDLVVVSCLDYAGLRKIAPNVPWPLKPQTQVLIHIREGDAVRITVGDQVQYAELVTNAEGRRVALVQFEGIGHASFAVKVYREVQ